MQLFEKSLNKALPCTFPSPPGKGMKAAALVKSFNAFLKVLMNTSKTSHKQKFPPNLLPQLHCSCCWMRWRWKCAKVPLFCKVYPIA